MVFLTFWWRIGLVGNVAGRINRVNQRRARLVLGWVTVSRWVKHLKLTQFIHLLGPVSGSIS